MPDSRVQWKNNVTPEHVSLPPHHRLKRSLKRSHLCPEGRDGSGELFSCPLWCGAYGHLLQIILRRPPVRRNVVVDCIPGVAIVGGGTSLDGTLCILLLESDVLASRSGANIEFSGVYQDTVAIHELGKGKECGRGERGGGRGSV